MPKFPTPSRCRRNLHHAGLRLRPLFDVLDNSYFLKWAIEIHQKPFPPPGVPYLDDQQGWEDYLSFDVRTQEELDTEEPTPSPEQQDGPRNGIEVVATAAAADDLLDYEIGPLAICNPDRPSVLQGEPQASLSPTEAFLFPPYGSLTVCNPDSDEALPEEQEGVSETPQKYVLSQAPASPASPPYQSFGLEDGCERAPSGDSSDVYQEEHIFFWSPETAQAVPLLPVHQPRLVTVPSPPAPPYRTLLSQNPRRRGVIFPFL
ncbi:hypothetical protein CDEST_09601 [Colletotrichum destructivum]|uniref:Uncharacterized protein n=1 Tax=Colletotrichum destructivum TaxID=34406 RepID=A0AAX4IMZ9_9PEZI|nr:hypothetical protein CDEST_09601 [Colletotrichum destructivum]